MLDQLKQKQEDILKGSENKNSRRDKRVDKEVNAWKEKISQAAGKGYDFDKITGDDFLEPADVQKSMLNIQAEIEPTLAQRKKKPKYDYDPVKGEKVRLRSKKANESKNDRKKRKQLEFCNQLQ